MTTALITHPACLEHDTGPYHPETSERLRVVLAALEAEEFAPLLRESAPMATIEQLSRVHPRAHVEAILSIRPDPNHPIQLDADTVMSHGSADAAARAAGGACMAVDAVMEGWARTAFAAVRPPGHHAEPSRPMGFCLFNNAAVAALHARARWGIQRVAVVDFDVHHGNGTQAMFAADPDLFYASSHQSPCYPGTGEPWERGVADNIVNAPLHARDGSAAFRAAWSDIILPALDRFAPGLLIVSAGFDAHVADPLAQLCLETADFAWITDQLVAAADKHCGGRLVSVLEGGYDLHALAAALGGVEGQRPSLYLSTLQRLFEMPEDDVSHLSFEDALAELDQIVRGLEGGTLKLDAAVQAFERGVKLRRHCEAKLAEVEARVEALVQRTDGVLTTRPLES